MIRRLVLMLFVLALLNATMGVLVLQHSNTAAAHPFYAALFVFGYFLLQPAAPVGHRLFYPSPNGPRLLKTCQRVVDWSSYLALGLLPCFFLYSLTADVIGCLYYFATNHPNNALFHQCALIGIFTASGLTLAVGILQALMSPRIKSIQVPIANLPHSFDGFKIAQISDLHIGPFLGAGFTERVVTLTNDLAPDIIALTGDFADGTVANLGKDLSALAHLRGPDGIYFVTGNHEYYWGASDWIDLMSSMGVRVLSNEHVVVKRGEDAIIVAGVPDYSTRHRDDGDAMSPEKALLGAPPGLKKILLAHQPISYRTAEPVGFDLQLSGHTHGGQYFPFNIVVKFFQPFLRGLYRHKNMWIYVSTGTGFWGPPLRTGVPSQIALLTLRRAT